jgi:hypothetical protein
VRARRIAAHGCAVGVADARGEDILGEIVVSRPLEFIHVQVCFVGDVYDHRHDFDKIQQRPSQIRKQHTHEL